MFAQLLVSGLAMGGIYATIAVGFTLLWNTAGVVNFAHGEFSTIGMFLALTFVVLWKWPVWVGLLAAVAGTSLIALVLERLAIRRVYGKGPVTVIILTVAAQVIMQNGVQFIWGTHPYSFPHIFGEALVTPWRISVENLWITGTVLILIAVLWFLFRFTMPGLAMRGISHDRDTAYLMGVPVPRVVSVAFMVSAAMGAVAGILVAPLLQVSSDLGVPLVIKAFMAAVVGGFGSYPGALLGGVLIGVVDNLSAFYVSSDYRDVITFCMLGAILLIRPYGFLGQKVEVR